MKKNSLELKKRQHAMLIEEERIAREKKERRASSKAAQEKVMEATGEVEMKEKKIRFKRARKLPRREYMAQRRQARLAKYAPRVTASDSGDIDMADLSRPKRVIPVSKTLRLVKDKDTSISK